MDMNIQQGILFYNGKQVNFKQTPNTSGFLQPKLIVLHDTASGLDTNGPVSWLCNPTAKASAHFVVGRGGAANNDLWQLAKTNIKTWHAGKSKYEGVSNVNNFSIGIEIVNPGWLTSKDGGKTVTFSTGKPTWDAKRYGAQQVTDDAHPGKYWWMPYTMEQIDTVIAMCRAMVAAYPSIKGITTHWHISPGRKVDTNPLFPLERVRSSVFTNRGPITNIPTSPTVEEKIIPPGLPPAIDEKDAQFEYDAVATANLNLRPWPDSPNRLGVIKKDAPIDFIRQSISQVDGAVWFLVSVNAKDVSAEANAKKDADGMFRGFVHSGYVRLVN